MAIPSETQEQHFVLRVMDPALADTLHAMLREEADVRSVDLRFDEPLQKDDGSPADHEHVNRFGKLVVGGTKEYPVEVQALPTVVESYKTYDDINLVKMTDIGQVLVVKPKESLEASTSGDGAGAPEKEEQPPAKPRFPGAGLVECKNGITPALQRARDRVFARYPEPVDPEVLTEVESQVLGMLQGKGLEDVQFVEEFYYVDEAGNGSWVSKSKYGELLRKKERQTQPVKKKGKAAAASAEAPDADVDMDDDDFA